MSIPFYVSPEQLMADKAEYAKKGIARGRSIVALEYDKGILLVAENPAYAPIVVDPAATPFAIEGVGVGLIRGSRTS